MSTNILDEIDQLEQRVRTENIKAAASQTREWGGADVGICRRLTKQTRRWLGEDRSVVSLQESEPRRRVVVTEHSRELSWLFSQLRNIFGPRIDYMSKYDFYGSLAQAAIEHQKIDNDQISLLLAVINAARAFGE